MSKSKEIIEFISNGKYAEAKDALRTVVTDNVKTRISEKQTEMGLKEADIVGANIIEPDKEGIKQYGDGFKMQQAVGAKVAAQNPPTPCYFCGMNSIVKDPQPLCTDCANKLDSLAFIKNRETQSKEEGVVNKA